MTTTLPPPFGRNDLRALEMELRRECARLERARGSGDIASEHHELKQALQRLADGSYGLCLRCGRAIPLERLRVLPATQHCLACVR